MVHQDRCSAVTACGQLRYLKTVMRSSLCRSRFRESVFWMWHNYLFLFIYFQYITSAFLCSLLSLFTYYLTFSQLCLSPLCFLTTLSPLYFLTLHSFSLSCGCVSRNFKYFCASVLFSLFLSRPCLSMPSVPAIGGPSHRHIHRRLAHSHCRSPLRSPR